MKKQILDVPFRESFNDFLHKDETILWEKTSNEKIETPILFNDEGNWKFHFSKIANYILFAASLSVGFFYLQYPKVNFITLLYPFLFLLVGLPKAVRIYSTKIHPTKYAITSKRILFRLSHLPKNKIYDIPFSQIKNCIVTTSKDNLGTIFLVVKNPKSIPFDTYHILENKEREKRHQPTLELIEDVNTVAELIRKNIENVN